MNTQENIPFSIDTVEISNFRLFSGLTVALHPKLTVFIAPNSGGKTAILEAIAMPLHSFTHDGTANWQASDVRSITVKSAGILQAPNWIKLGFKVQSDYLYTLIQKEENPNVLDILCAYSTQGTQTKDHSPLHEWASSGANKYFGSVHTRQLAQSIQQSITNENIVTLPLIAYFTANRRVNNAAPSNSNQNFDLSRAQARLSLLPCSDLRDFDQWLRERAITGLEAHLEMQEMGEKGEPTPDTQLQAVSTVLATMLEKEIAVRTVKYSARRKSIQVVKNNGEHFALSQLSHGAKSILVIAAKLAMHCCALNPHLREQAPLHTPGVILIDEIDLHLHPKWQQHVINDLQCCFPSMQFILSTHSPTVLTTLKQENIREINIDYNTGECAATTPLAQSYGESIADTLETIMGVSARPDNELVRNVNNYLDWAENGILSEDRSSQRSELEKQLGKDHLDLVAADFIRNRRIILAEQKIDAIHPKNTTS